MKKLLEYKKKHKLTTLGLIAVFLGIVEVKKRKLKKWNPLVWIATIILGAIKGILEEVKYLIKK
jgi:uncharacterized membrane protein YqgA involved in biofilm formation